MGYAHIRKILTVVEETHGESGRKVNPPTRKAAAIAVIENPCAAKYVDDLEPLMLVGQELGALLGKKAVEALGVPPGEVESYGKAAIVGEAGEREHAAAVLHPRLGKPLRAAVEKGDAIIPSAKKIGGLGTAIDVPLHFKNDEWSFNHFDAMEVSVPDAPHANEIVVVIAVTDSGRPLARIQRPAMHQIKD
ncbi:MAG: amino acid synthesis family protein [Candidatus Methylomirabilia bacterium]